VSEQGAVYLSVAATNDKPAPRAVARDTTKKDSTKADSAKKKPAPPKPPPKKKEKPDSTPLELSVELIDAAGNSARLPLSRYGVLRRPLDTRVYRRAGRDTQRFATIFELIPQTFVLPLADFVASAPQFTPARLRTIRLVFDRSVAGTVVVTDIGVSTPTDPAFLAAPVP
jgi:hypothetical protein